MKKFKSCDFCGNKIEEFPYALKLYKKLFSDEFLTIHELCDSCHSKLNKFLHNLRK